MARAHGARAQMALAFETVYGTAPATGFRTVPFASTTLGSEQPLIASELLGQGRDPLAPIKDAVTADGDVVVPIDVENLGLWLKAAFGQPATTGTTPKTHTFQSGNWTLPSLAIEAAMPEVPRFAMYTGCVCDQLSWQMARSGLLTATARLLAQGETVAAASAAGTTTALALQRFGHFNGAITRNGTPLGNVVSAEVTYANGLDRIETIRNDGRIEGADPGMAALTGQTAEIDDGAGMGQRCGTDAGGKVCTVGSDNDAIGFGRWRGVRMQDGISVQSLGSTKSFRVRVG